MLAIGVLLPVICGYAQATGQSQTPDILICKDGEKFVGHLVSSNDLSVVFKSDAAGQVTVNWSKVQELHTSTEFAVLTKGVKLRGPKDQGAVPLGTVVAADQQVQIKPPSEAAPQTLPVTNVAQLVNEAAFRRAFRRRNFFEGWSDKITVGIAYTNSTQKSQSYTTALNLTRVVPDETWLDTRRRTLVNLYQEYGEISAPATPTTKISILHVDAEQDWYLHARLFAFVQAIADHNYSQGLDLQQDYGGGLGFHVLNSDKQTFDVKAGVSYVHQQFTNSNQNNNLIGATFGDVYLYKFPLNITFTQTADYIPAKSNTRASSGDIDAQLTFPVYRRLGFTVGAVDDYVNNAPIGFKKNSFAFTFGATYSFH
ncbi:MAG TPA: DUF481 domain-containing protein [Bryobacteraceae bacterium]|jgi:hypothetical protein|nr:DUF481 domain-containing protein [Bryobacteraceae bacterium]